MRTHPPFVIAGAALLVFSTTHHADALAAAFAKRPAALARRAGKFTSLTGAWSGEYVYPYPMHGVTRVPFNARLVEKGIDLTGDTDEPNTFAPSSAPRLFATIVGTRGGSAVEFVKTLDGTGGVSHAIHYAGTADSDLTRIEGTWHIPGNWSGTFMMERAGLEASAAVSRSASAAN
ncbi:MAG: hypothetical protein WDM79_13610 [Terricaulis sp.]